ncbi:MAG: glycosyltransferase family 39 protein [Elusimicrobiota bacterium]
MADKIDDLDSPDDQYGKASTDLEPEAYGDAARLSAFEDTDNRGEQEGPVSFNFLRLAAAAGCLLILLAFHAFQLSDWIRRDNRPPPWDQSIQLEIAQDVHNALARGEWGEIVSPTPKPGMPPFPPLHYLLIQYAMDGPNPAEAALWINLFYMAALCVSLFAIGRRAAGEWAGVAAAVLLTCIPEVQWLLRDQTIDLALTAWVAAAYWALLESDHFDRKIPSILFGVLFSVAMLTKWSAFSYFLPVVGTALGASNDQKQNRNLMLAAGIVFLLLGPWYLSQWSVLIPRLIGASSDNAVPLLSYSGLTAYIRQMGIGMEFPFFVLGAAALLRLPRSDDGRKMAGQLMLWFIASFIFWTIVPNRQLRYLLPALAPLALLASMTYDKRILGGLCAFMLLAAANYPRGWIPHINPAILGFNFSFFRSDIPAEEDWPLAKILRRAEELHDKEAPFGNLALLANHNRFNGATFNWELDRLGIETIKMRGINKRVCELAEFLLLKTESLGPPSVVNQLPGVRKKILAKNSWFQRGYKNAASWDLPDGSQAVLYQRQPPRQPPLIEGKLHIDYLEEKAYLIEQLDIDFGRWNAKRGVYPIVTISAKSLRLRDLKIENLSLVIEDLFAVPVEDANSVPKSQRDSLLMNLRLLKMKKLDVHTAVVSEGAVKAFIAKRVGASREVEVKLDDTVSVAARIHGIPLAAEAELKLSVDRRKIDARLLRLSAWGVPVPTFLLGPRRRYTLDLMPNPELPFAIGLPKLRLAGGKLRIGK